MSKTAIKRATVLAAALGALSLPAVLPAAAMASTPEHSMTHQMPMTHAMSGGDVDLHALLAPVPSNRVHGYGYSKIDLNGNTATVTVHVHGLLDKSPHAMHIHIKGEGTCPEPGDATLHNGHRAMSTADGLGDYGRIGTSLTTSGDTSPASALAVDRFPATGTFTYTRRIQVSDEVATAIRHHNAVVVVHGIDYNGNGKYDAVLGASELNPALPEEATAPALCGALSTR